jgi:hypothetical protein
VSCAFKITIVSKSNNDHLKFKDDFKNHIIFGKTEGGIFFFFSKNKNGR